MTKSRFCIIFLLVVLGISFVAVNNNSKAIAAAKKKEIVAIFQVGHIDFFVPTRLGCVNAAKEYGVDFKFMGPPDQSVSGLISIP